MPPRAMRRASSMRAFGLGNSQQGAAVAGGNAVPLRANPEWFFELQQAHDIGYGGAVFAGALGDLLLGEAELFA